MKLGLSEELVREISRLKNEPKWMLEKRLEALRIFNSKPMPTWGPDLSKLDFSKIRYFVRPTDKKAKKWEDVPPEIKRTFEKLGIPEAERRFLAGSVAQYESESVYSKLREMWESKGVIFTDMDTAVQKYPELVKRYFMTCVPPSDNKFAALHGAVWSGGSFAYIPKGVKLDMPLQTYFRMQQRAEGQFEHTLIIAEPGSSVHYVEGCTAPAYSETSLHSAVVEIFVKEQAHVRYSTIQNWSKNVYNLNTKRAFVDRNGHIEWIGGSFGSGVTMLYPGSILRGSGAKAEHLAITVSSAKTWKEGGARVTHLAPNTSSKVVAKSISTQGGHAVYRGLVRIAEGAKHCKASVRCDALLLDERSQSDTYPRIEAEEADASITHEATAGRVTDEQLFYLMSRGISRSEAEHMVVMGFLEPVTKELPLEYAVELNRLVKLELEGPGVVG